MSDNWGHYFANMGGHASSTLFDDGISREIDALPYPFALKIRLQLKEYGNNGLTTNHEAEWLDALEMQIDRLIRENEGLLLGRVTSNGVRWILGLVSTPDIKSEVSEAAHQAGYSSDIFVAPDPIKSVYWDDLYPDGESRQVMSDMRLLNALHDRGDQQEVARPVDHWTYFDSKKNAKRYSKWLSISGYSHNGLEKTPDRPKRKWLVRSHHECTMMLNDITHHTLNHYRNAKRLFGDYDGWETRVEKKEEA